MSITTEKIYLSTFKQNLKALAETIRKSNVAFKEKQRSGSSSIRDYIALEQLKREYRHKHIAYCLFRGRTMDQIESNGCFWAGSPNKELIREYLSSIQRDPYQGKLYVIADRTLSKSQQGVQAGHAVAEYLKTNKDAWGNGTLAYLKTTPEELQEILKTSGATPFYEEDLGGKLTAIAACRIGHLTKHLQLM